MYKKDFRRLVQDVSKRSGICQSTVEQVIPALFDEIRLKLVQGTYPCLPVESFGTFAVVEKPARRYHYYRPEKGIDRWVDLPVQRRLKFGMARNMKRELERGEFDPSRKAFVQHPDDPPIRRRHGMRYSKKRGEISKDGPFRMLSSGPEE